VTVADTETPTYSEKSATIASSATNLTEPRTKKWLVSPVFIEIRNYLQVH
jgi:hypothetical protein